MRQNYSQIRSFGFLNILHTDNIAKIQIIWQFIKIISFEEFRNRCDHREKSIDKR